MFLLLVYFVLNSLNQVETAPNRQFSTLRTEFKKVFVDFDDKIISNLTGWLSEDASLNLDMHVKQLISSSRTTVTVKYRVEDSMNYLTLLNYDIDTCKTLKEMMATGLVRVWFRNIRKYGNMSPSCPIKPSYYNLRNLRLESQSIPVFLRPGDYRIRVFNYNGKANAKAKLRHLVTCVTVEMKFY
ncbi:uncharacterized protein LOC133845983 [Drosophila sulfurigaster albostrigata]|uniref:uncharacterized protein LOC133845983 n=1 Tax=Drosophila sulfurigaster albostrigata TaxID=89887 RepID=UPI002D21A468|nr:uncharacterized protein LOC133845983 [Drosophila sulfurigaster albostrigata]